MSIRLISQGQNALELNCEFNGNIDLKAPIKQGGKVDSVNGMTGDVVLEIPSKTSQLENDSGFITEHQDISGLATKQEVAEKQDKLTAGDNITITGNVISASGSDSEIKSIALTTNRIYADSAADYKEALTYLWGDGSAHSVDLSQCIVTIDGIAASMVYVRNPYILFYTPVLAKLEANDTAKHYYTCNYIEAINTKTDYKYITKAEYATNILTSDNYTQYITGNSTYTQDISDYNLYNAKEVYVHIQTSDSRNASVTIQVPENYVLGEKANENYYFPESETSNGYLWYDGSAFCISGSNTIDYIWYK